MTLSTAMERCTTVTIRSDNNNRTMGGRAIRPDYRGRKALAPIIDYKTKNKSFIEVQKQLQMLGIKNNEFFLILLNPLLQGIDPHSPTLSPQDAMMVVEECQLNIFYFLREVVRIPEQGAGTVPFRLDRGTLAACYCFANNQNFYLMKPRQTGKSVGICACLAWAFKFGITNGQFMFAANRDKIGKDNLKRMKTYIAELPPYMAKMGTTARDSSGKTVRKTNNIKSYIEPVTGNTATVANCAISQPAAEEIGRGDSHNFEFFDEAEFTSFIETIVQVSGMAFNTASQNAIKNGAYSCRIFATTPGDLSDKRKCQSALKIVDDALPWSEQLYDEPVSKMKELVMKKSQYRVIYIEYDYKQLGLGEDWFITACSQVGGNVSKIRREILLQRFSGNSASPFTEDEITELQSNVRKPLFTKVIARLYNIDFYIDPDLLRQRKNRLYFLAVDPSDGTGSDNYGMTILDPYSLETVAEFKSPYMTPDGCIDLIEYIVTEFFPKVMIIIESNRNGTTLIDMFRKTWLRPYIYAAPEATMDNNLISDKLDDNGFIKEEIMRRKYFGVRTTQTSRDMMMSLLVDSVRFKKDILYTQNIVNDINNLVLKNNKIQAAAGEHDDSVMSWCLGMYVLYYGKNLENWGFKRNSLPDDIEQDDEYINLQKIYSNPEIRKQFPSMFAFYSNQVEDRMRIEYERRQQNLIKETSSIGIGSIKDMIIKDEKDYVDNLKSVRNGGDQSEWKQNILDKWKNLNR
jgi:hypothetical protein